MVRICDRRSLVLLLSLVHPSTSLTLGILTILPLTYQSKDISFSDWVSILTLCITPLLAHIIAGTPNVVCLSVPRQNINWRFRICQYNPTTILWRYFAVADRRLRAKAWDANHLAASNALFWTHRGWDGSEAMIEKSRQYCIRPPEGSRSPILSKSFVKTVIVTLQGVQATWALIGGFTGDSNITATLSISSIFFPLAVLGLLRLCAAPWLTDDFVYAEYAEYDEMLSPAGGRNVARQEIKRKPLPSSPGTRTVEDGYHDRESGTVKNTTSMQLRPYSTRSTVSYESLLEPTSRCLSSTFRPTTSWRARFFRFFFMLPILGLLVLCILELIPWSSTAPASFPWRYYLAPTMLLVIILYSIFIIVTSFTFSYYFLRDLSATTVIPCIVSTWYQIYTLILIILMVLLIIVAAVETRKAPCGIYTSWPADWQVCPGTFVKPDATDFAFGLATRYVAPRNTTSLPQGEYRIVEYDGWCTGTTGESQFVIARNLTLPPG